MKIFGLGLSKTGTQSLTEALRILGFTALHYPHDLKTYSQILNADFQFDAVNAFDAVIDTPVVRYYAQLDELFPKSKFIMTVRDMPSWLTSCQRHWCAVAPTHVDMNFRTMIDLSVYGCARFHRERFQFVYEQHAREVRRYFRRRTKDYLEMNIVAGDGWEPLCRFLELPIPPVGFPHRHRTGPRQG